jgi:hypothetical protein
MRNLVRVLLCLALSLFAAARAVSASKSSPTAIEKKSAGQKADAKSLLHDAKKATAVIIKSARADKDLDPTKPRNKPFWQSVHALAKSLAIADAGLAEKKDDFFKGIADARAAEEQLKVDWQLTDSKNKSVIENGKKLGHALTLLRTDFSKEAERKKKGGELTDKEKTQFEKIKAQQKELLAKISKLEGETKKDKALEKGLSEVKKQAERISKQPTTLDAYIATLYLLDLQAGLIRGYLYYVDPEWRKDYLVIVNYTKMYDTWRSEWETSVTYDWAVLNTAVDVHEGENVEVADEVSDSEISAEDSYAEKESFEMSEAEQNEVAVDEDNDEEMASVDDENMEEAADDEADEQSDDAGDDDGADDGGGD